MTQRQYRRLTRGLFLLLFFVFVLLYFLLTGRRDAGHSGGGWGNRTLDMGVIRLSEVRSGGFILDDFPIPAATRLDAEDFNENTITFRASIHNEAAETVAVTANIYGTDLKTGEPTNPGLCGGMYYQTDERDPVAENYAAFFRDPAAVFRRYTPAEKKLDLRIDTARYPLEFELSPGESRTMVLFFWADEALLPALTDPVRERYSVTVKLTSRGL